jgi:hypothetical protein
VALLVGLTLCVPERFLPPLQEPEAVHEVALLELQVSVEEPPEVMLVGLALSDTVGAGFAGGAVTLMVAESEEVPPSPVQLNV